MKARFVTRCGCSRIMKIPNYYRIGDEYILPLAIDVKTVLAAVHPDDPRWKTETRRFIAKSEIRGGLIFTEVA